MKRYGDRHKLMQGGLKMTVRKGIVKNRENEWAWVAINRQTSCGQCGSARLFSGDRPDDNVTTVKAKNDIQADIGNTVILNFNEKIVFKGILWLFIFPLIPILAGAFSITWIAETFGISTNAAITVTTLVTIVFTLVLIRVIAKRLERNPNLTPSILSVVRNETDSSSKYSTGMGCSLCN